MYTMDTHIITATSFYGLSNEQKVIDCCENKDTNLLLFQEECVRYINSSCLLFEKCLP